MPATHRYALLLLVAASLGLWTDAGAFGQRRITIGSDGIRVDDETDSEAGRNDRRKGNRGDETSDQPGATGDGAEQRARRYVRSRRGERASSGEAQGEATVDRSAPRRFENLREFQEWSGRGPSTERDLQRRPSMRIGNWTAQYGNQIEPFSSRWYDEHPDAWRNQQERADAWVNVPSEDVTAWLGWDAASRGTQVVPGVRRSIARRFDPSRFGEWLPLGVFMLMSSPDDDTRLAQLAVNRAGELRGVYYDAITDNSYNIVGRLVRDGEEARWSLRTNRNVTFRTRLSDLFQPWGRVRVSLPGGEHRWEIVRVER